MLLLTGATGVVGSALLRRLVEQGRPVRCLVRDPRRLGELRVRVQITLGDLSDPHSFRNATRGVQTVVHLPTATRDQAQGSIEELTAMSTWRMAQAAQRTGVERFVLLSALGASLHHPARLMRAKAVAEQVVRDSSLRSTVVATSFTYAPADRWLTLIERLARLPAVPVPGSGRAHCQPIWAQDVADCLMGVLHTDAADSGPTAGAETAQSAGRYELAGPQTLSYDETIRTVLRCTARERPLVHVPAALAATALRRLERTAGAQTPLTWDEAQLLAADSVSSRGPADARALGVEPQPIGDVLGG